MDAEDELDDAKLLARKLEKRAKRGHAIAAADLDRSRAAVTAAQAAFTAARRAETDAADTLLAYGDNGFPEAVAAVYVYTVPACICISTLTVV